MNELQPTMVSDVNTSNDVSRHSTYVELPVKSFSKNAFKKLADFILFPYLVLSKSYLSYYLKF